MGDAIASGWRKLMIRLRYENVTFGRQVRVDRNVLIRTSDGGRIAIGDNTHIWPGAILDARNGEITIGDRGLVNAGCYIVSTRRIHIGCDALIAEYVTIRDQDHEYADPSRPYSDQGRIDGEIVIGDNVWLGAKVTVTRDVQIADGTIVGANSVVTRSLSGARIFAGAPARPLETGGSRP
ncbi:MAG: acyltransferase [Blastomonas sp.]